MANEPLESLKFPGIANTFTVPPVDNTLTVQGAAADAKKVGDEISDLKADLNQIDRVVEQELEPVVSDVNQIKGDVSQIKTTLPKKVNQPLNNNGQPVNGTSGQVLRTKGDGSTEWASVGLPTDAQTAQAVTDWLDEHPEATTTVEDGSITEAKLNSALAKKVINAYITPQSFGAVGDGVADDTAAFESFLDSDGVKFVPKGDYLVNGTVKHYGRGVLGNGNWDNSLLPAYSVWFPNGANPNSSILFNSGEKNLTDNEMASVVLQEVVHYEDDDPTPNENFTRTTGLLYTGTYEGYTENSAEAITQNFAGIQSIVRNNFGGIIGTSAIQGRLYIPEANEAIQQYGGNKGVAVGGGTFTSLHCSYGGYAYGAELDCYDNCTEGTFPTYTPGDSLYDSNSPRVTASLVLSVSGKTQPATACLITNGAGNTGAWNGIYFGGTTFGMNGQYGVDGTVGINFAGWKKNGKYAHTAIRFGHAVRQIVARDGMKISSTSNYILPTSDEDMSLWLVRGSDNHVNSLVFGKNTSYASAEDMDGTTEDARISFINSGWQMQLRTKANMSFLIGYNAENLSRGYVMTPTAYRPTWDGKPSLGDATRPFGQIYAGGINFTGGTDVVSSESGNILSTIPFTYIAHNDSGDIGIRFNRSTNNVAKLSFGYGAVEDGVLNSSNYTEEAFISYVKSGSQLQIASESALYFRVNKNGDTLQGYVLNGSQFRPAHTTKPSFGDNTRRWGTAYFDTLNLNGVTLNSTQLTQLLALLN